jgi:hypothetical protein
VPLFSRYSASPTVEQVARRAKIESLQQAIDTQKQGLSDLTEEASKYK